MTEIIKHKGRLQFITHKTPHLDELAGAEAVLRGGCRWIQLRMKQATTNEIKNITKVIPAATDTNLMS